ncbi:MULTISPECIES: SLC13 family permease [unclassified Haladaptatus]|uniref:SLC13 family permease n=1 Tax=unclassified Haladaptatus TaxID=2622732 RepID=UPI0023E830B3|nr:MULTISPECIES: SLC13 family permease [unclassified Haladaptatus]
MAIPPPSTGVLVVFALIVVTVVLFITERLPADITAIALLVTMVVLQPWTQISAQEAISGFSNAATITIVAMYILSAGIEETGLVQQLGSRVGEYTAGSQTKLLAATIGLTGPVAGFINNTPVVAVFIPMVTDLADQSRISPSKLLIPLSYAAMLGGTLTLIGTATNILASDISADLIGHPFSMFEFTPLGILVLLVGALYLMTVGQYLLPERILAADLTDEFELEDYLVKVTVSQNSPLVGQTISDALSERVYDVDVIQIVRGERLYLAEDTDQEIEVRDVLTVRGDENAISAFAAGESLRILRKAPVTELELAPMDGPGTLVETIIPAESSLIGQNLATARLRERYAVTVLAIRRGEEIFHDHLSGPTLQEGDGFLLHATDEAVEILEERGELLITELAHSSRLTEPEPLDRRQVGLALGIIAAVVAVAALNLLPIVIAALGGVVAMVVTDVIRPSEAYDAVNWEVIFLLAGIIPLGLAMQETGGATFLGSIIVEYGGVLPAIVVLALFYLLTGLLADVITPVASVVLTMPIAVDAALRIGAEPFAFVLAVTFAASTAFMTPVGYQTNLMVYSPGGYRFIDYVKIGAPLQLLLTVVTTLGIAALWGV